MIYFTKTLEIKSIVSRWVMLASLLLLLPIFTAFAATCPSGYVSSTVKPQEYSQWPLNSLNSTITAAGSTDPDDNVVITASMTDKGSSQSIKGAVNASSPTGGAFFIKQNMRSRNDTNTITYKFDKPLSNLSMSIYDIDREFRFFDYNWKDKLQFIAKDKADQTVSLIFSNNGEYVTASGNTVTGDSRFGTFGTCSDNDFSSSCKVTASFNQPITELSIEYGNASDAISDPVEQNIEITFDDFCVPLPTYTISKDDGLTSIGTNNTTDYIITVTNTGDVPLKDIMLKDPAVTGLSKQANIICDSTDANNVCNANTVPTIASLEGTTGFNISSIPVGKSYSIVVPTLVTAASGSTVQNTATATLKSTATTKTASDINKVTSIFDSGSTSAPASCPSGHQMYYIGENPPKYTLIKTQKLSWASGTSNTYTIGGIKFTLSFPIVKNILTGYPKYEAANGTATKNSINMFHTSQNLDVNHQLTATIDRPVTKYGFVVQDLDADQNGKYTESIKIKTIDGILNNFSTSNHELSNGNQTITGIPWKNCNTSSLCNFNIDWGYSPALAPFIITHGNTYSGASTTTSTGNHLVGYSDFYFCLAPPKLVIKKALNGSRINDTDAKRDQFEIKATGNSIATNSFITTGKGTTINKNTSAVLELEENKSYTITERVMNGTTLGDIANYDATYVCNNTTTGSTIVTTPLTYDASNKTRSFTLANTNYSDEITCTIINTPKSYTFSGTVFNDNGGITSPDSQLIGSIYNNPNFFNGILDTNESGIDGMNIVKVGLSDCSVNLSANPIIDTVEVTSLGKYIFTLSAKDLEGKSDLCIEELEPDNWLYSVDTTPNIRKFSYNPSVLTYRTGVEVNGSKLNLDFGNVIKENTALVLVKSQYVHDCSLKDLMTIGVNYDGLPTNAFSKQSITGIEPSQCIAYRIQAINRGNVPLTDIIIKDNLQKTEGSGAFVTSVLADPPPIGENEGLPNFPTGSVAIGSTGMVITNSFNLGTIASNNSKAIRFNTKYGNITAP
ncbi:COG1361 family protein [Psychrobacter maritimus]|jgi:hypothetical protein|uniref:hypothetical protein n=1 Tax=Psychrobacter maritimus TaxID=256325 RepID=UPI00191A0570|nr:hypothetical protein [Psychrobacter maritimus]